MLKELTIIELDTYLRLCEHNMDFLATKRRISAADKGINDDYNYTMSLRSKLYNEINIRLKDLTKKDESIEEVV